MNKSIENKKRILYVITQGVWGGAQRYIFDLVSNLSDDFEIIVAVGTCDCAPDLQNKLIQYPNVKLAQLKHLVRPISPWRDFLAVFELANLYRQIKPNIIHLNSSKAGVIGSLAKLFNNLTIWQFNNLNIIYTVHGWVFNEPLNKYKKEIYFWSEKITARWKNKIIVLSKEDEKDALNELGLDKDKINFIPLGIVKENFLDKKSAREFIEKKAGYKMDQVKLFVTVANLFPTKGLDILIEAVNQNKTELNGKAKFVIIGEGPERSHLTTQIKKNNLEELILLVGSAPDASRYLSAFDFFVLPSRKEGLPYTILEALQAKIPIIATAVGGVPSLIKNKDNGLLVLPNNSKALADVILYATTHSEEMKAMADKQTESHELAEMLKGTVALYNE